MLILASILVLFVVEAGALVHYLIKAGVSAEAPAPVAAAATVSVPDTAQPDRLALNVERRGQALRLHWDRNAAAVREASRAMLYIRDGKHTSQLTLDSALLHSGVLSYWPETATVEFRMELLGAGEPVAASVRSVNGPASEPAADVGPTRMRRRPFPADRADRTAGDEVRPSPFVAPKAAKAPKAAAPETAREEAAPKAAPPAAAEPPARVAAPRQEIVPLPDREPEPEATEVHESPHGSRLGRFAGKIPLLKRLVKHPPAGDDRH